MCISLLDMHVGVCLLNKWMRHGVTRLTRTDEEHDQDRDKDLDKDKKELRLGKKMTTNMQLTTNSSPSNLSLVRTSSCDAAVLQQDGC